MNFIRKANVEDFPAIYALIKEFTLFQKTPERLLNIPEQMLEERELFQAFVAEEGKDIIGFASFFFAYYSWSGKALYLDDLYVKENFSSHGAGKQLLESII